jgi:hypothetical protein
MKKVLSIITKSCVVILAVASSASAASLTGVYDFRDEFDVNTTSFEGLDFTDDGTLWITSSPNGLAPKQLIGVDLGTETVTSVSNYSYQRGFNPVGLASDGTKLFLTNNLKSSGGGIYKTGVDGTATYLSLLSTDDCQEPEGAAYLGGHIYVSCQNTQNVVKLDAAGNVMESFSFGVELLGLGATENLLIVGDYTNHALLLYDVSSKTVTETIDLAELFPGYAVYDPNGILRNVPDPDGLAYRDGKIYMTFEHDLRVYEINIAVPEPGTLLLIGSGLLALAGLRRKRS